jgi:hypothetical protein
MPFLGCVQQIKTFIEKKQKSILFHIFLGLI